MNQFRFHSNLLHVCGAAYDAAQMGYLKSTEIKFCKVLPQIHVTSALLVIALNVISCKHGTL